MKLMPEELRKLAQALQDVRTAQAELRQNGCLSTEGVAITMEGPGGVMDCVVRRR